MIADFNICKQTQEQMTQTQIGTPFYASPEIWREEKYGPKTDVWSLGCVAFEMCMLLPPFKAKNMDELYVNIQNCNVSPFDDHYSRELQQLVLGLLSPDDSTRPTCLQLLSHPLIAGVQQRIQAGIHLISMGKQSIKKRCGVSSQKNSFYNRSEIKSRQKKLQTRINRIRMNIKKHKKSSRLKRSMQKRLKMSLNHLQLMQSKYKKKRAGVVKQYMNEDFLKRKFYSKQHNKIRVKQKKIFIAQIGGYQNQPPSTAQPKQTFTKKISQQNLKGTPKQRFRENEGGVANKKTKVLISTVSHKHQKPGEGRFARGKPSSQAINFKGLRRRVYQSQVSTKKHKIRMMGRVIKRNTSHSNINLKQIGGKKRRKKKSAERFAEGLMKKRKRQKKKSQATPV